MIEIIANIGKQQGVPDMGDALRYIKLSVFALCFLHFFLVLHEVCDGRSDEDCGESTDHNTEYHCEDERADCIAAEDEDTEQHEQR